MRMSGFIHRLLLGLKNSKFEYIGLSKSRPMDLFTVILRAIDPSLSSPETHERELAVLLSNAHLSDCIAWDD